MTPTNPTPAASRLELGMIAWKAYATLMNGSIDGMNLSLTKPPHCEGIAINDAAEAVAKHERAAHASELAALTHEIDAMKQHVIPSYVAQLSTAQAEVEREKRMRQTMETRHGEVVTELATLRTQLSDAKADGQRLECWMAQTDGIVNRSVLDGSGVICQNDALPAVTPEPNFGHASNSAPNPQETPPGCESGSLRPDRQDDRADECAGRGLCVEKGEEGQIGLTIGACSADPHRYWMDAGEAELLAMLLIHALPAGRERDTHEFVDVAINRRGGLFFLLPHEEVVPVGQAAPILDGQFAPAKDAPDDPASVVDNLGEDGRAVH